MSDNKAFDLAKDGLRGWTEAQRLLENRDARLEGLRQGFKRVAKEFECPVEHEQFLAKASFCLPAAQELIAIAFDAAFPELKTQNKADEKG